jgi:hypothetical protein
MIHYPQLLTIPNSSVDYASVIHSPSVQHLIWTLELKDCGSDVSIYCEGAFPTTCVISWLRLSTFSTCSSQDIRNSLSLALFFWFVQQKNFTRFLSLLPLSLSPTHSSETFLTSLTGAPAFLSRWLTTLAIPTRLLELCNLPIIRLRAPETRSPGRHALVLKATGGDYKNTSMTHNASSQVFVAPGNS